MNLPPEGLFAKSPGGASLSHEAFGQTVTGTRYLADRAAGSSSNAETRRAAAYQLLTQQPWTLKLDSAFSGCTFQEVLRALETSSSLTGLPDRSAVRCSAGRGTWGDATASRQPSCEDKLHHASPSPW